MAPDGWIPMTLNSSMLRGFYVEWKRVPDRTCYPFTIPAVASLDDLDLSAHITIFVGENGTGKSTLLEAIAVQLGCNPEGGSRNFKFENANTLSELHQYVRLVRGRSIKDAYFYRADTYYNLATEMQRLDAEPSFDAQIRTYYGGEDLHQMSHGQSVIKLVKHRFKPGGVYVMDEPEAALSPMRQFELIAGILDLASRGAQFILATHSPILMAIPNARIFELDSTGIGIANYDTLQHVQIYRRFLGDPASMLRVLMEDPVD